MFVWVLTLPWIVEFYRGKFLSTQVNSNGTECRMGELHLHVNIKSGWQTYILFVR